MFDCKRCGVVKSFRSSDPDECAWAQVAQAPQRLRMGIHEVDELAILAMAGDEMCCNCASVKEQWAEEEFRARSCEHCLARRRAPNGASARHSAELEGPMAARMAVLRRWKSDPNLVAGAGPTQARLWQHGVTLPEVESDPDRDDLDVSVVGRGLPPSRHVLDWLDALKRDPPSMSDRLNQLKLEDQLRRSASCSASAQHEAATPSNAGATSMQKLRSMIKSIKPSRFLRSKSAWNPEPCARPFGRATSKE